MKVVPQKVSLSVAVLLALLSTACTSRGALEETQAQLVSLQQRVEAMSTELVAARSDVTRLREGLTAVQGDGATLKTGLASAQGDATALKSNLSATTTDLSRVRADLTSTANSLSDLKNTLLTGRQDQEKRQTKSEKIDKLTLVADLYNLTGSVNSSSAFDVALDAVTEAAKSTGEADLLKAWNSFLTPYRKWLDLPDPDDALLETVNNAQDAFLALLRQKLVEAQK